MTAASSVDEGDVRQFTVTKDDDGVRLEAANSKYKTIRPGSSLMVSGVVKAVIRKYK